MRRVILSLIAALGFALPSGHAIAQALADNPQPSSSSSPEWSRVQNLTHGEVITVARRGGGFAMHCRFAGAIDNALFCDSPYRDREARIELGDIDNVRRDDLRRNVHILIGSFAAAGFVWGLATPNQGTGEPRGVNAAITAAVGALAGCVVSVPVALLIPGRLVYRRPPSERGHSTSTASPAVGELP